MLTTAMDWPLSREEKKTQLLRLYSDDVRAADSMLCSGNRTLEALRAELQAVRSAAGVQKTALETPCTSSVEEDHPIASSRIDDSEVQRLRQALESASAVLRAILPQDDEDPDTCTADADAVLPKFRARSEGAGRAPKAIAARPALCRTPRNSRRPKRKVSFGGQPEEEPPHSPKLCTEDGEDRAAILHTPALRAHHAGDKAVTSKARTGKSKTTSKSCSEEPSNGSRLGVHLTWLICSLVLVVLCGYGAFQMGARHPPAPPVATPGDKSCWKFGFNYEFCCDKSKGSSGNVLCWDADFTYDRCCKQKQEL